MRVFACARVCMCVFVSVYLCVGLFVWVCVCLTLNLPARAQVHDMLLTGVHCIASGQPKMHACPRGSSAVLRRAIDMKH